MTTPQLTRTLVTERSHSPHRERSPSRYAYHSGLASCLSAGARNGVLRAVDLVPAGEIQRDPSANALVQISTASYPLVRNARSADKPMSSDFTGSSICSRGIHCRGANQRTPGALPHIRQVPRGDLM